MVHSAPALAARTRAPSAFHRLIPAGRRPSAAAVPSPFSNPPLSRSVLGWQLFGPTDLKDRALDAARMTAISEVTRSLIQAESLPVLFDRIADGFHDIFPYATLEVEFRSDILSGEKFSSASSEHFPYLSQNRNQSRLLSRIPQEPFSVEDVNQKLMGLPLLDKSKNLLGMIVLSLGQGSTGFPEGIKTFAEELRLGASMLLEKAVKNELLIHTDALTGVGNRGYFNQRINEEFSRVSRSKTPLSLLLLDIDHFKRCNDTYGHPFGDKVLKEFAGILKTEVRGIDLVMRYGGEEFAIILPETPQEGARAVAERIREAVREHSFKTDDGQPAKITVSIGVSSLGHHSTPGELISSADKNLYKAKKAGRDRVI